MKRPLMMPNNEQKRTLMCCRKSAPTRTFTLPYPSSSARGIQEWVGWYAVRPRAESTVASGTIGKKRERDAVQRTAGALGAPPATWEGRTGGKGTFQGRTAASEGGRPRQSLTISRCYTHAVYSQFAPPGPCASSCGLYKRVVSAVDPVSVAWLLMKSQFPFFGKGMFAFEQCGLVCDVLESWEFHQSTRTRVICVLSCCRNCHTSIPTSWHFAVSQTRESLLNRAGDFPQEKPTWNK